MLPLTDCLAVAGGNLVPLAPVLCRNPDLGLVVGPYSLTGTLDCLWEPGDQGGRPCPASCEVQQSVYVCVWGASCPSSHDAPCNAPRCTGSGGVVEYAWLSI
jgi:hypothetical protein